MMKKITKSMAIVTAAVTLTASVPAYVFAADENTEATEVKEEVKEEASVEENEADAQDKNIEKINNVISHISWENIEKITTEIVDNTKDEVAALEQKEQDIIISETIKVVNQFLAENCDTSIEELAGIFSEIMEENKDSLEEIGTAIDNMTLEDVSDFLDGVIEGLDKMSPEEKEELNKSCEELVEAVFSIFE